MTKPADIIIRNGRLTTFDDARPTAQALAISGGLITAVGDDDAICALAGPQTQVLDARGGSVLPGFIDSHVHLFMGAAELDHLSLLGVQGRAALHAALRGFADARPDEPLIIGIAADYDILGTGDTLTRQDLDAIIADRPVALMAPDHHTVWANTAALTRAGLLHGARVPEGSEVVMAADGTAAGQLNETGAFGPVMALSRLGGRDMAGFVTGGDPVPPATPAEREFDKDVLERGLRHCAEAGLTSVHNMDGNFYQLELLAELESEGRLHCRVEVPMHLKPNDPITRLQEAHEMRARFGGDKVWCGRIKMFMDGVLDSYTAYSLRPYPGRPDTCGEPLFTPDQFNEICIEADKAGLQISVHAIGDAAVRQTLDGYGAARAANGARDSRHRIEHTEVIHPDDIPRYGELGVVASFQPLHSPRGRLFPAYAAGDVLHDDQFEYAFAWQTMRDAGAVVTFSTDWPVVPVDVMRSVAAAVDPMELPAPWVDQRQSLMDTLASYTRDNAWMEFNEHRKGVLKPGYMADVTVMSDDLFALAPGALIDARPVLTICDGRISAGAL